jgi:hypothetical protein
MHTTPLQVQLGSKQGLLAVPLTTRQITPTGGAMALRWARSLPVPHGGPLQRAIGEALGRGAAARHMMLRCAVPCSAMPC